ncbi:head maturation protease, ClpP-related [Terribacillus sp. DMT04]|uniref:head maturation protease, ClpP-related n=1 Tax=Terribacillus sp. DMT04 TaxID=2850441 RepID=UPI001C2BA586|nr:head maturation protease, ClpP-related [Terribacillus sp. DMT04]QXE02764.1 Clp protease ClpP [Terribacillus sp. DMT04]
MSKELKEQLINMMTKKSDVRFEANTDSKEARLYIYGPISSWSWSGTSAKSMQQQLTNTKADVIHVHINSPGGSAFDGVAIGTLLKNHKAKIVVHVDGFAASAASVIAMAGDEIIMPENTMLMIHRASTIEWGNAAAFEKTARDLRKIDTALAASYKKRFIGEDGELEQLLDDETWLTAEEAVAFGLADTVSDEIEIPELEDEADNPEEQPDEYENSKEKLLAKYGMAAQTNKNKPKETNAEPAEEISVQNVASLFLKLKL